jgi:alpha/beta superfamily hydrolase
VSETPSRLVRVAFAGPAGSIEGQLQEAREGAPAFTAVVCHPHPLYGGTMHNKVVHRVASALHQLGASVLRFNFRGVGKSEGTHDQGVGELEDARAALEWMRARHPRARRWLAGFSFGSWVAARLAAGAVGVDQLILIAPPVTRSGFQVLKSSAVPKLVVQGTADDVCPIEALETQFPSWSEPRRLIRIEGAGHFFDRQLAPLGEAITTAMAPFVPGDGGPA